MVVMVGWRGKRGTNTRAPKLQATIRAGEIPMISSLGPPTRIWSGGGDLVRRPGTPGLSDRSGSQDATRRAALRGCCQGMRLRLSLVCPGAGLATAGGHDWCWPAGLFFLCSAARPRLWRCWRSRCTGLAPRKVGNRRRHFPAWATGMAAEHPNKPIPRVPAYPHHGRSQGTETDISYAG